MPDTTWPLPARIFRLWTRATLAGWVLGIPCIVALALVGELLGIGGSQVLVGAGMGIGLGLTQSRVARLVTGGALAWFWSCVGGLAVAFSGADVAKAFGWTSTYSLQFSMIAGGALTGMRQALILRARAAGGWAWVLASVAGWTAAALAVAGADIFSRAQALRGLPGALIYLALVTSGGLLLGMITAATLAHLLAPAQGTRVEPGARRQT